MSLIVVDELDYWRFCNELTLVQAALLLVGKNPSWDLDEKPDGYDAAITAVSLGLRQGKIEGRLVQMQENRLDDQVIFIRDSIDLTKSTVMVDSLRAYLESRGRTTGFFFPEMSNNNQPINAAYLDPSHPRYAPKLAAAVRAWIAVGEFAANSPRTPKQQLEEWLLLNADDLKLTDQGSPNRQGIKEVAKVANWKPTGGAPKTPGNR